MRLIGISGRKQSGKSSSADFLLKNLHKRVMIRNFSDSLKEIVWLSFDYGHNTVETFRQLYATDESKKHILPCGHSVRYLLQYIGTDIFRKLDHDCWINAFGKWKEHYKYKDCIIIADVRFPNEVKYIQSKGGIVIRLLRTPFPEDKHESETALDIIEQYDSSLYDSTQDDDMLHFNATIDNRNMTLEEKNLSVLNTVEGLLK